MGVHVLCAQAILFTKRFAGICTYCAWKTILFWLYLYQFNLFHWKKFIHFYLAGSWPAVSPPNGVLQLEQPTYIGGYARCIWRCQHRFLKLAEAFSLLFCMYCAYSIENAPSLKHTLCLFEHLLWIKNLRAQEPKLVETCSYIYKLYFYWVFK